MPFKHNSRSAPLRNLKVGPLQQYVLHPCIKYLDTKLDLIKTVRYVCKVETKIYGHEEGHDYFIKEFKGAVADILAGRYKADGTKKTNREVFEENESLILRRQAHLIQDRYLFNLKKCTDYADYFEDVNAPKKDLLHCRFIFIWGCAGSGKTAVAKDFARALYGDDDENGQPSFYIKSPDKWWHNYRIQNVVIADEIRPDLTEVLEAEFKIWGDRNPFQIEIKG